MTDKKVCCVVGCSATNASSHNPLYAFPSDKTERFKRWLHLFPNCFDLNVNRANYICRQHFTPESFDVENKLLFNAVPTVNIELSYARGQILKMFLIKVIYEWSLRVDVCNTKLIAQKAVEAKELLGIRQFEPEPSWLEKFTKVREVNSSKGIRYGLNKTPGVEIIDIIRDLRPHLPSNFVLPIDSQPTLQENQMDIKKEYCANDDDGENCIEKTNQKYLPQNLVQHVNDHPQLVESVWQPQSSPSSSSHIPNYANKLPDAIESYEDALQVLKPLESYLIRIGNVNAQILLQEITNIIKNTVNEETEP